MAPGGYAWWYLDALSTPAPDGSFDALTAILFVGSAFSPYYAAAQRRQGDAAAPAEAHCAVNIALYRCQPGHRTRSIWCMTERGSARTQRSPDGLQIGRSRAAWQGGSLVLDIDEWAAWWPRRLIGRIRLTPGALPARVFALDTAGHHGWQAISPTAQVEVDFAAPDRHWQGPGYLDCNGGSRPLARDFSHWHWSRAALTGGRSQVLFDLHQHDAAPRALALGFDAQGGTQALAAASAQRRPLPLPRSAWGLARQAHCDSGATAQELATLEDGPFYSRHLVRSQWQGEAVTAMQESLSLQRLATPWVQALLPFRMPRRR